jgi:transglutaminase-like putative cysteine protease
VSAHGAAAPLPTAPRAKARPDVGPLLPWRAARLIAFLPLAAFGALHWATLVAPRAGGEMLLAVGVAAGGGLALGACTRLSRLQAGLAAVGIALVTAAGGLMAAGIPLRLLLPGGWGELASGVTQGLQTLPDIRVPYAGVDDWPRLVILGGAALLLTIAAAAAFWPSRRPSGAGHGLGAVALCVLYAVPAVDLTQTHQFVRGAAFAALLAAFLWFERVPRTSTGGAAAAVAVAVALGLAAAPALDGDRPWIDYEQIAQSLAPASAVTFDFSHQYGPIDWPRDGREVLRVKARRSAYWKAENLDEFDGRRWRALPEGSGYRAPLSTELPEGFERRREWHQRIEVTVRSLAEEDVVGAGITLDVMNPPSAPVSTGSPGTYAFESTLERGDSYAADVYTPRPNPRSMTEAGTEYGQLSERYFTLTMPTGAAGTASGLPAEALVRFPAFGSGLSPTVFYPTSSGFSTTSAGEILSRGPYARTWALAQRLRARSRTPYEYVRRVLGHLAAGYAYSESPPRHQVPLESFLFDDRIGYCQHFSGAMALLVRMAGIPARVSGGFSPGSYSRKRKDYVIRDFDAHSWVEVWFPHYGWVTFDPTPAAAPARSQLINVDLPDATAPPGLGGLARRGDAPEPGPPTPRRDSGGGGVPWVLLIAVVALLLAAGSVAVLRTRRRRVRAPAADPDLEELERALRRSGRPVEAGTTLAALERRFRFDEGATAYLRALQACRYGFGEVRPSPGQRRGLRRALAEGLGWTGRLRALWALPPRWTRSLP